MKAVRTVLVLAAFFGSAVGSAHADAVVDRARADELPSHEPTHPAAHEPAHAAHASAPSEAKRPAPGVAAHEPAAHAAPEATAHGAPSEHAAGHGEGHAEHDGPPPPINWLDFSNPKQTPYAAMVANFALLAFIYWYFGKKKVKEALEARQKQVTHEIEEAARLQREAEARAKVYQEKLANLENELAAAKHALSEAGKVERDRLIADAEEKAVRLRKDAAFLVEQEFKQFREDLLKETVELAVKAAEETVRANVGSADQERLAGEFLKQLESNIGGAS